MHRTLGTGLPWSFTLGMFLLLACAGGGGEARSCAADAECPPSARCDRGACVADAAPVAVLAVPEAPEAHALVTLDGSGSSDPDQGDRVASFAWTVSAVEAPCDPPAVAGTGATAPVRFACPGRYEVRLVVSDLMGVSSPPAVRQVDVGPRAGAPLLTVGPDVTTGHRCSGQPLRCAPDAAVELSAATAPAGVGEVTLLWSVIPPPDRPLAEDRRVALLPGPDHPTPAVALETDGAAISGDWLFQVEARDGAGVMGTAVVRVSVANRPPTISGADPGPAPHAFLLDESAFVAAGGVPVSVTDPDGDPIPVREVTWRHAGDGEGTFTGQDAATWLSFAVRVPYADPADALHLIGGADLVRAVEVLAQDVNGGEARRSFPVRVDNRPPVETTPPGSITVGHTFDAATQRYQATALLSRWVDPDGDPLRPAGPTGDQDCARVLVLSDGRALVECSRPFLGAPALLGFAAVHQVAHGVGDPWESSAAAEPYPVRIENSAPGAASTSSTVAVTCTYDRTIDECCHYSGTTCVSFPRVIPAVTYAFVPKVSDADGDPLEVRLDAGSSPTSMVCAPGQCGAVRRTLPEVSGCGAAPTGETVGFSATDGLATASATHTVTRICK